MNNKSNTIMKLSFSASRASVLVGLVLMFAFVGCQAEDESLAGLEKKRTTLKIELNELEQKISELDTAKLVNLPLVEVGQAQWGEFLHKINVQGNVETDKDALINAEVSGVIHAIEVKEGQQVKKGQTIAVIDAEILASNIAEVKSQLEFAEYALEKQEQLMERGVGTEFEYKQAKNQVNALKSQLNTLSTQKGKSLVRAPFDGLVDQVFPKVGELANPQSPIVRLVNNKEVYVVADISERHYKALHVGTPIEAYVPTLSDTFKLSITNMGNYIHPTNRTFRVRSKIEGNEKLLPNMLVQLQITDLVLDSVLIIPSQAVLKSQQNEDYIFVAHPSKEGYDVEQLTVEVISRHEGRSAVRTYPRMLEDGERVVTRGGRGITAEDQVQIR